MKSTWMLIVATSLLSMSMTMAGQNASDQTKQGPSADKRESQNTLAGLEPLWAELTMSVDTKKVKADGLVTARLLQDVKANNKVALNRGTNLIGHVTLVEAQTKEHPGSRLAIVFDKAVMRGQEIPLHAFIQAVVPPPEPLRPLDSTSAKSSNNTEGNFVLMTGGVFMSSLKGVFGMPGVSLAVPPDHPQDAVIISGNHNIKLEDGSQMILRVSQTPR